MARFGRPTPLDILAGAFSRRRYEDIPRYYGTRAAFYNTLAFGVLMLLALGTGVTVAVKYLSLAPLRGATDAVASVVSAHVDTRTDRRNRITHATTVTYTFKTPDGLTYSGSATRVLNQKLALRRAGPVAIKYDDARPERSTISAELDSEVSSLGGMALLFFALAAYFGCYVYRYVQWRRSGAPRPIRRPLMPAPSGRRGPAA